MFDFETWWFFLRPMNMYSNLYVINAFNVQHIVDDKCVYRVIQCNLWYWFKMCICRKIATLMQHIKDCESFLIHWEMRMIKIAKIMIILLWWMFSHQFILFRETIKSTSHGKKHANHSLHFVTRKRFWLILAFDGQPTAKFIIKPWLKSLY